MTQPVYDPKTVETFLGMIRHLKIPVLIGILPLYSHKNAEFLHNEVPGMSIPDDIRERMRVACSGPTPSACATSWPSPAIRRSSGTTRTRPRYTTWTRSG